MALDFTDVHDHAGAALYVLHTGNGADAHRFERMKADIEAAGPFQCVVMDAHTPNGEKIRDFYDFTPTQLPVAFIVRDDDSIHTQWSGNAEIPTNPSDIVFHLRQVGGQ